MSEPVVRPARQEDQEKLLVLIDIASAGFVRNLFGKIAPPRVAVDDFIVSRMESLDSGLSFSKLWVAEINAFIAGFIALDKTPAETRPVDPDMPRCFGR